MFADDTTVYVENPKETPKNLLELISDYSKIVGHKVNIQKSTGFQYTSNGQLNFEIKGNTIFISTQKINEEIFLIYE